MDDSQTEPLLYSLWRLLDSKVDTFMVDPTDLDMNDTKAAARGVAEAIQLLMVKFYPTPDDVVREAVKRYKARQANQLHESPGLGEFLWDPNFDYDGKQRTQIAAKAKTPIKAPAVVTKITDQETLSGIKNAHQSGMFTKQQIAEIYKINMATLESVIQA
jgi:hypothetical protein